ncbi:hypothetical protein [Pseudobutyrivibrio sp.]|jgi:hypothetical protein|uniref:hypothetical protein n=1 Tax=Pseudobutyrivibrio sp. TaxID=2014367 RepID=UPI0025D52E97|nr:hypothetical protein [Pseudobutyrivibrio sp.]
MLKKVITTATIMCVIVATIASTCSANLYYGNEGINDVHNGSYWARQAWVDAHTTGQSHMVRVGIQKNGTKYGIKPTTVSAGTYVTCKSYYVQIDGGSVYKDPVNP